MILRRITANFRRQDWMAVVVELVIVVLGVFIGLQVSNWNEARVDARLGRDYVQRLTHDLDQDHAGISVEVTYYADVLKSVRKTDELLRTADPDPGELIVNAYRASELIYIPMARATWDQIVSSGHLGLLPAGVVESGLSQYYSFDRARDVYQQGLNSAYRQTVRKIIPMTMQIAMQESCSDLRNKTGHIIGFAKTCKFDTDPAAMTAVATALRHDSDVLADLQYQYDFVDRAMLNLVASKNSVADALTTLSAGSKAEKEVSP